MIFNAENILLIGSILLFVSIVVSKTGYRFGIPTLLVSYWTAKFVKKCHKESRMNLFLFLQTKNIPQTHRPWDISIFQHLKF
jgi:hypothetical protein